MYRIFFVDFFFLNFSNQMSKNRAEPLLHKPRRSRNIHQIFTAKFRLRRINYFGKNLLSSTNEPHADWSAYFFFILASTDQPVRLRSNRTNWFFFCASYDMLSHSYFPAATPQSRTHIHNSLVRILYIPVHIRRKEKLVTSFLRELFSNIFRVNIL